MRHILLVFLFFCPFFGFSQELPPLIKYGTTTYEAGNQNWMITQDENHYIYFANNEGLLEFNGSKWKLYPSETILRSVKAVGDKIYSGCYMDFGYWSRQKNGLLRYTSLSQSVKEKIFDDSQFWNIISYDKYILFQSLNQIFIYHTEAQTFRVISSEETINKIFRTGQSVYCQIMGKGLFEIRNEKDVLVSDAPFVKETRIVNLYKTENELLLYTQLEGFYKLKDNQVEAVITNLPSVNIYSSLFLENGYFVVGTVSDGIFILNENNEIQYHICQENGLSNNTALSLYEDADQNLWVGLDNGINCINLNSPVRSFFDNTGILGTVYASMLFEDKLYIGTNQGLFYKEQNSSEKFRFIKETKGQVWALFVSDGTLFCGHDSGTFVVNGASAYRIFSESGTWKFLKTKNESLILQGNYYGISVLEKQNGKWTFRNKIDKFDYSSRYFEILEKDIYVSHEYKGVFRFSVDDDFRQATALTTFETPQKGKNAGLCYFDNAIFYASKDGVFRFDPKTKQFEKHLFLSKIIEGENYTSGKLITDTSGNMWVFTKDCINYFSPVTFDGSLKHNSIPIPYSLSKSMSGYENITQISEKNYLIGTTDGYYIINTESTSHNNHKVFLTDITTQKFNEQPCFVNLQSKGLFKHNENNISFSFTIPEYSKYNDAEYSYLLEGFQKEWSSWNRESFVFFKNLPHGEYTFKLKAKIGDMMIQNMPEYSFSIKKPWYITNFAVILYVVLFFVLAYFINKAYKNYYHRQKEKLIQENLRIIEIKELENEQNLMKMKNEQLRQDIESKTRELAASTMNLIRKNEILGAIKDDLKKSDTSDRNIKSVISVINNNINEEDTWNLFEEAFNKADKDFLKKIKEIHPSLTPNDLRLCAYLRMNLSSKEIAPLLNISVRSVEIKRYRLRKKMELPHENSLVEYILLI